MPPSYTPQDPMLRHSVRPRQSQKSSRVRFTEEVLAKMSCGSLECAAVEAPGTGIFEAITGLGRCNNKLESIDPPENRSLDVHEQIIIQSKKRGKKKTADIRPLTLSRKKFWQKPSNSSEEICKEDYKFGHHAYTLAAMGDTHVNAREYNDAKRSYTEALRLYKLNDHEKHVMRELESKIEEISHILTDIQHSMDIFTIGMIRLRRGEYEKSLRSYTVALRLRQSILGENHPSLAIIYNNIAISKVKLHRIDESLNALSMAMKVHKGEGVDRAVTLRHFGMVYEESDDVPQALDYYYQSLSMMLGSCDVLERSVAFASTDGECMELLAEIDVNSLPEDSKHVVEICVTLNKISELYRHINHLDAAIHLSDLALEWLRRSVGDDHPKVVSFLSDKSLLHRDMGDHDMALKLCGEVLVMNSLKNDKDTRKSATTVTLYNIGCIEMDRGNSKKAMKFFQDALGQQLKFKFQQRDNPLVAHIMMRMAELYESTDMFEKAEQTYMNVLKTLRSSFGMYHIEVARAHHKVGKYYCRRRSYSQAREEFHEAEAIFIGNKRINDQHSYFVELRRDIADVRVFLVHEKVRRNKALYSYALMDCLDASCYDVDDEY